MLWNMYNLYICCPYKLHSMLIWTFIDLRHGTSSKGDWGLSSWIQFGEQIPNALGGLPLHDASHLSRESGPEAASRAPPPHRLGWFWKAKCHKTGRIHGQLRFIPGNFFSTYILVFVNEGGADMLQCHSNRHLWSGILR